MRQHQAAHSPTASSVEAYLVPPSHTLGVWPLVKPFLARAAERGGEHVEGWLRRLADERMQLWIVWNGEDCVAAVLTELAPRRNGLTCQIVACGGDDMKQWLGLLDEVERWAKTEGCVAMRVPQARKGWMRALPDYAVTGVILERDI